MALHPPALHPPLDPALFDLDPDRLWVMHCSEGPVPKPAAAAMGHFLRKELRPWELRWAEDFQGIPQRAREEGAKLLGADVADLSLTATTSSGLLAVAQGFPWEAGDEVLAPLGEFPSNAWPWMALARRGVAFRELPLWEGHRGGAGAWDSTAPDAGTDPEGRLLEALGPRTKVLALSWVRFQDGLKLDLARLGRGCRERGVRLVVDGIQGAGTHRPDLRWADAFTSGGHKGLLAPQGQGLLWTSSDFRRELMPSGTWLSVEQGTDFSRPSTDFDRDWVADGRRLEPGSPAILTTLGLLGSLQAINEAGPDRIEAHVTALQGFFLERLEASCWRDEARRLEGLWEAGRLGPILSLHHGGRGSAWLQEVLQAGMRSGVLASVREGYLRIAFHGWHTEADALKVLNWVSCAAV